MQFEIDKHKINLNNALSHEELKFIDDREFVFNEDDFNFIKEFIYQITGIVLHPEKKVMVYARLSRRLRELNLHSFAEYCRLINEPQGSKEITHLINALTTNLTKFFRESHHFDHLKNIVFGDFKKLQPGRNRSFRIWSAGCSSGEEPYSIAMVAADSLNLNEVDCKILATDIDTQMLASAQTKAYKASPEIPKDYLQRFCDLGVGDTFNVKPQIKRLIHFKRLNLLEAWPMKGLFDVIFCRNVAIYFDKDTQINLFDRFADILAPNGWLYIGHSENLHHISERFKLLNKTIYQKIS